MTRKRFAASLLSCALLAGGCGGGNKNAQMPAVNESYQQPSRSTDRNSGGSATARGGKPAEDQELAPAEKKSFIGRVFGPQTAAGYGWDGQYSSVTTSAAPDIVYNRAGTALRALGFTLNSQQSQFRGTTAQVVGARQSDGATAQVLIATKTNSSTEIKSKVGALGDRTGSERILDEIQKSRSSARN